MQHDTQVFEMRRKGIKPATVTICDAYDAAPWWQWRESSQFPEVHVGPRESPELADLRFCVGLPVLVDVKNPERCARWAQSAKDAGAKLVISLHPTPELF